MMEDPRDGLNYPWTGERVWCNPPYNKQLGKWVEKAATSKALTVMLLPPSIETKWFHDWIWDNKTDKARTGVTVKFLPKRLHFLINGVPGDSPRAGNMVVTFHNEN